jgi:hypothetical protein
MNDQAELYVGEYDNESEKNGKQIFWLFQHSTGKTGIPVKLTN